MTTPTEKKQSPLVVKYMPCMYLWVAFKVGGTKVFYSRELRNSLKQIAHRGILPHIDYDFGFQGLQFLAENTLKGQYNRAIIYGLKNENTATGFILAEYDREGKYLKGKEQDFKSEKWQEAKDKLTQKIQNMCMNANVIISVFDKNNPIILR